MNHQIVQDLLIAGFGSLALVVLEGISRYMRRLTESVEKLNENMAVVVSKLDNHEKRLDKLEGDGK